MTLHLTTSTGAILSAKFNADWEIIKAWLNDIPVRLTEMRERIIFNAFNATLELEREKAEMEYSRRNEYNL